MSAIAKRISTVYGGEILRIPITYTHQRDPKGLALTLLTGEEYIDDDFVLLLGDNNFRANLEDVLSQQQTYRADAAFLVEEVP